jgi:murein L,D-transpeptidase YafK
MKRWILVSMLGLALEAVTEEESTPTFFAGGDTEIDGQARDRVEQAIGKWTSLEAWGDEDPTGEPYFWDFDAVGKEVFIRIIKGGGGNQDGLLQVWLRREGEKRFELYKSYRVARFSGRLGPKKAQGDFQAPEGFYYVSRNRMNPRSNFHLSMNLGYPNEFDRYHGYTGDYLMIHGSSVSIGCYAMTDASIEQIYTLVDAALANGQRIVRVHCFPFEMTKENLKDWEGSEHESFWKNLKEGWDWFEERRIPPNVGVSEGEYSFSEL